MNSKAAAERKVVLQFDFSGELEDACYFVIENSKIATYQGRSENPDITIQTPFELWMDIMTRKADGQQMFLEQKYKVDGDLALMLQLFQKKNGNAK